MVNALIWEDDGDGGQVKVVRPAVATDRRAPLTPAEKEAIVQAVADTIMQSNERDMAMAKATVDLVMAERDGQLVGLTLAQIRSAYRDRVVQHLREARGI